MIAEGTVQQLLPPPKGYMIKTANDPQAIRYPYHKDDSGVWVCHVKDQNELENAINEINVNGVTVLAVDPIQPSLEDVFISYVSGEKQR